MLQLLQLLQLPLLLRPPLLLLRPPWPLQLRPPLLSLRLLRLLRLPPPRLLLRLLLLRRREQLRLVVVRELRGDVGHCCACLCQKWVDDASRIEAGRSVRDRAKIEVQAMITARLMFYADLFLCYQLPGCVVRW